MMLRWLVSWLVMLGCALVLLLTGGTGVALADDADDADDGDDAHDRHPVQYNMAAGVATGGLALYSSPPGANDFGCRPSDAHPRPVVLIHGAVVNRSSNWQTLSPYLANRGYCVFALTYGVRYDVFPLDQVAGADRLRTAAETVRDFVGRVRKATGAREVDLVGHSEGTIAPQYYLRFLHGAREVRNFVAITGIPGGVPHAEAVLDAARAVGLYPAADAAVAAALPVLIDGVQGSDFMRQQEAQPGGSVVPGVEYTQLLSRYDELTNPAVMGQLPPGPHVHTIVTQDGCPVDFSDHASIVATRRTGQVVLNALDPEHAAPLPCDPVLPAMGSDNLPFLPTGPGH